MSKLSIIVAIYNVADYLDRCLLSLSNQITDIEYEVLCVNDGSTDNSKTIINKYVEKYDNFKLLDKANGGISDARNYGLKYAHSPYISFVDGDDFVNENYVNKMVESIERYDLDMMVFGYNQHYINNNAIEKICLKINEGIYNIKDNKEILAFTPNAVWNKIYKRELFDGIEFPYGYRHQDLAVIPKLLLRANKVGYCNECLYHYIVDRKDNVTSTIDEKIYHIIDIAKNVLDYYKENKKFEEYSLELEYLIKRNFIQSLRKAMLIKNRKFVYKFIDDLFDVSDLYFKNKTNKYKIDKEKGDSIYLSRAKCKIFYFIKMHINY